MQNNRKPSKSAQSAESVNSQISNKSEASKNIMKSLEKYFLSNFGYLFFYFRNFIRVEEYRQLLEKSPISFEMLKYLAFFDGNFISFELLQQLMIMNRNSQHVSDNDMKEALELLKKKKIVDSIQTSSKNNEENGIKVSSGVQNKLKENFKIIQSEKIFFFEKILEELDELTPEVEKMPDQR